MLIFDLKHCVKTQSLDATVLTMRTRSCWHAPITNSVYDHGLRMSWLPCNHHLRKNQKRWIVIVPHNIPEYLKLAIFCRQEPEGFREKQTHRHKENSFKSSMTNDGWEVTWSKQGFPWIVMLKSTQRMTAVVEIHDARLGGVLCPALWEEEPPLERTS